MTYVLAWISLLFVSISLIFLGKWVKKEAQICALIGLVIVEISLIMALSVLK